MKNLYIEKLLNKLENAISDEFSVANYDMALRLISVCASLLYQTNIRYTDDYLEKTLEDISNKLNLYAFNNKDISNDTVLFYDGFGLNERGLIQIYLKAICKIKHVIYVTYEDRKDLIPNVDEILDQHGAEKYYIKKNTKSIIDMVMQLNNIVINGRPSQFFFYSVPDDVVATPILYKYKGIIKRNQINLTDHAFWLGAGCCDKCINFRAYGAKISYEYRHIEEERNVVIPFYPVIHRERAFDGFPFEVKSEQKIIFSGGSLYKTLSADNRYYNMVDHILSKYHDVIFWYAGSGDDSKLKKILSKYPKRAFHTEERSDLFQILENSDVYLSTYPLCGGLMFQYAASAGIVPVTLKQSSFSDDFLIEQENIKVVFENEEKLYEELDKLLTDNEYYEIRSKLMKKSVISQQVFEDEVRKLVYGQVSDLFKFKYEHIDSEEFQNLYLDRFSKSDINSLIVRRNTLNTAMVHYPLEFLMGGVRIVLKTIMKKL